MMKKIFSCDVCEQDFEEAAKDAHRYPLFSFQGNEYNGIISFGNTANPEKQHYCDDCFIQLSTQALTSLKK